MNTREGSKEREMDIAEAEAEAARTRVEADLQALGDKLTPENIKEGIKAEAKEAVTHAKEATMERVTEMKETMTDAVSGAGRETLHFAQRNPIPLALIGAGIGWLLATRSRREPRLYRRGARVYSGDTGEMGERAYSREPVQRAEHAVHERAEKGRQLVHEGAERGRQLFHGGAERGRQLGHQARERVTHVGQRSREYARESPLAMGALSLAAGLGVGLALPTTRREEELLRPARERLVGQARGTAEDLKQTARDIKDKLGEPITH